MLTKGRAIIEDGLTTDNIYVKVAKTFEACRCSRDFAAIRPYLAEDVALVFHKRNVVIGIAELEHYWIDREERAEKAGLRTQSSIRACKYNCHASLYETIEGYKTLIIMFRIVEEKVTHVVAASEPLHDLIHCNFEFDKLPLSYDYVMDNVKERIKGESGRLPCMKCGKLSENLQWHKASIEFRNKVYGGEVSVCRSCGRVVEFYPTDQKEMEERTFDCKNGEDVGQYTISLDSKEEEHEYVKTARDYYAYLSQMSSENEGYDCEGIVSLLNELMFNDELCVQYANPDESDDYGDVSYLYFKSGQEYAYAVLMPWNNGVAYDQDVFLKQIQAECTAASAWQIYLLTSATYLLPTYWHGEYIRREYILCERDLKNIRGFHGERIFERLDITPILENYDILPRVELEGNTAHVTCCYWNNWKGLIREHKVIRFLPDSSVQIDEKDESELLYRYHCGIYL